MCPRSPLEFKAFLAQNRALAVVWRTCALLTTVFIDWIGHWRSWTQKSALLYSAFRVHISETIIKPTQSSNCALRLALLNFSLRFCSASKTYCKTTAKITFAIPQRYTLHTVSTHTRFFEKNCRKTLLARTHVQSVRAEYIFVVAL